MNKNLYTLLKRQFQATELTEVEVIQALWSNYGKISRLQLEGSETKTLIAKQIEVPKQVNHPRGWNTAASHVRKVKSYEVEQEWYTNWSQRCTSDCRVAKCYLSMTDEAEQFIVLEDLDAAGFPKRMESLSKQETKVVLSWLAHFHALFMNEAAGELWQEGSYWNLSTRQDELAAMEAGKLKEMGEPLDQQLKKAKFQTIIHGDAKLANFCFSEDSLSVAAVDFQYVGKGCGMKDVVYFMGSCLNENECEAFESELLAYYFETLKTALEQNNKKIDFVALEKEWRKLYAITWTDFTRFLMGWMPTHQKINGYSQKMMERAFGEMENLE